MQYEYVDEARNGDHICYISNLARIRSHYPEWDITRSLDDIMHEIVEAWTARLRTGSISSGATIEAPVFGGRTVNRDPSNVYSTASQNLIDFLYAWYNADPHHSRFFATNNIAVSRGSFRTFGGFDVSFPRAAAEDRDFCDRWREKGGRLEYVPEAAVRHMNRLSLQTFIRQHSGYGRGAVYLHNARRRRGASLPRIEPIRFYRRLVFWPLGRGFGWRTPTLLLLAAVSQASYAFGYYTEQLRRRWKGTSVETGELAAVSMPSVQEKVGRP